MTHEKNWFGTKTPKGFEADVEALGRHEFCYSPEMIKKGNFGDDGKGDEVYEAIKSILEKVCKIQEIK